MFRSAAELRAAFPPLPDRAAPPLVLWSPAVTPTLEITTIALDPGFCDGHTARQSAEGDGLVRVTLGGVRGRAVVRSGLAYRSPGPGRTRGAVDWAALDALFGRVAELITGMAAGTVPGRPVLPRAYELGLSGFVLKDWVDAQGHTRPTAAPGRPAVATTAVTLGRKR